MNKEIIVYSDPKCGSSEAIRTLRTNLQFTFVDKSVKVLMVTSSISGEGKSFISANLAAAFGMVNQKVLIIDCDLRKGRQNEIFNIEDKKGLSSLLLSDIKKYKTFIHKTEFEKLSVLPSGIVPPNPSELLGLPKFKELLNILKEEYDLILLDCPPISAVTDALVLSKVADEAVIVAASNYTPSDLLVSTTKALQNTQIKIAGIILNKIKGNHDSYYYSKYYN